jgi:hypothetical protein
LKKLITSLAFVIVSIVYWTQIANPPRLVNDGVDDLLQASSAIDGNGFLVHGVRSMRSPGYPALIRVLAKAGIGNFWALVALNCLLPGIRCGASYFVLHDSFGFSCEVAQFISLLTLLSFLMVRNLAYPLSDIAFLGACVPCPLVLIRTEADAASRRFWRLLILIPLMLLCIELRRIGVVLIPAFIWAAIAGDAVARNIYPTLRRASIIVVAFLLTITAIAGRVLLHSRYMQFNLPIFHRRGVRRSIAANVGFHTADWRRQFPRCL